MLAKLNSRNQLTLPKDVVSNFPDAVYFDAEAINGQIVLRPVRIQQADVVRAKLASLNITEQDVSDAAKWDRRSPSTRSPSKSPVGKQQK